MNQATPAIQLRPLMWTRLSAWKRRQMLLIAAICIPLAAWLGLRGEYTMAALLSLVPILAFVETWGEVNPTRRTRSYWTVLGIIVLAFALLLLIRWTTR